MNQACLFAIHSKTKVFLLIYAWILSGAFRIELIENTQ